MIMTPCPVKKGNHSTSGNAYNKSGVSKAVVWAEDQSMDYAFLVDDCMFKSPNGRKIV